MHLVGIDMLSCSLFDVYGGRQVKAMKIRRGLQEVDLSNEVRHVPRVRRSDAGLWHVIGSLSYPIRPAGS